MDPGPREVVAALDCGTNSTRLLISAPGAPEVRLMRITRLGQGVDATKKLDHDAIARTVAVLMEYRELMDRHAVTRARLVATSSCWRGAPRGRWPSPAPRRRSTWPRPTSSSSTSGAARPSSSPGPARSVRSRSTSAASG